MSQIVPCYFAPDIDNGWAVAPGALLAMDGLAPLQSGAYGSMGTASLFNLTGSTDLIKAKLFRQIAGTVRMLVFRTQNIDEYTSGGTKTNQGTGYNASTTNWEAAAWGNQIIAVNYLDAPQSSTGTTFGALSGSPPKARYVASNVDFVMFADVDDGGSNVYSDMVWWSGLRNPSTWTPALSTQAGNIRLLAAPGPIRQLVAFRNGFVAFKDNALFYGEYVGPPPNGFIFNWTLVSNKVGCITPDSVVELDGKLYFLHSSGFYEFDGQSLRNIGIQVHQNFLSSSGYLTGTMAAGDFSLTVSEGVSLSQAAADEIEGVYWVKVATRKGTANTSCLYGYNVRSQKWGRIKLTTASSSTSHFGKLVTASAADMQTFNADSAGRIWMLWADPTTSTFRSIRYPAQSTDVQATVTTGWAGSKDGAQRPSKFYWRTLYPSTINDTTMTVTMAGAGTESNSATTQSSANASVNTEFDEADFKLNARYVSAIVTWTLGSKTILAGVGWGTDGRPR